MTRSSKPALSAPRAARLYRFIELLAAQTQTRQTLMKKLKLDVRGFYRDLEYLKALSVELTAEHNKYALSCHRDDALAKLPFPDPGLNLRDALLLAKGNTEAHRKLKKQIEVVTGKN